MIALLQRISPACYKQIHRDNLLTLPSADHLRRLSSSIDMNCMELTKSSIAYLTARYNKLDKKGKLVSILMDEVYSHQDAQYVNGKFYGVENGELTKTLLCVMVKSIAGKYRDIVSMPPVVNINADKLYSIWKNVVSQVTAIGFDVAVTITDGHSSNMKLFNNKILQNVPGNLSVPNKASPGSSIYLLYDTVHLFKNLYNNWMTRKEFECPRGRLKWKQDCYFPQIF